MATQRNSVSLNSQFEGWACKAPELGTQLLAIVDEVVRTDQVSATVAIDDAIMAKANPTEHDGDQKTLEQPNTRVREAVVWSVFDRRSALLHKAIGQYEKAWEAALRLVP